MFLELRRAIWLVVKYREWCGRDSEPARRYWLGLLEPTKAVREARRRAGLS